MLIANFPWKSKVVVRAALSFTPAMYETALRPFADAIAVGLAGREIGALQISYFSLDLVS